MDRLCLCLCRSNSWICDSVIIHDGEDDLKRMKISEMRLVLDGGCEKFR